MISGLPALVAILVAVGGSASAASPEQIEEARRYFDAGQRAFEQTKYDAAIAAFSQSQSTVPHPAISFSLAQAFRLRYFVARDPADLVEARRLYSKYLAEALQGRRRDHAVEHLSTIEPLLLRLEATGKLGGGPAKPSGPPTQLMVSASVEGAAVVLDDRAPAPAPLIEAVAPGRHSIQVTAPGYFAKALTRVAVEGLIVVADVELEAMPATVRVEAPPGAEVLVGGKALGPAPLVAPLQLQEGTHRLEVLQAGRYPFVRALSLTKGAAVTVQAELEPTAQRQASWWILGVAGASAVSGAVTLGLALKAEADAKTIQNRLDAGQPLSESQIDSYRSRKADRGRLRVFAGGFLASTLAFGLTGAIMYFVDVPSPVEVGGAVTAESAAVSVRMPLN